jgi:hypothetical protein
MPSARLPKSLIIAGVALGDMKVAKTPIFMDVPPLMGRHYTTGENPVDKPLWQSLIMGIGPRAEV